MENFGFVHFRESKLLVPADEENRSSAAHTQDVANIIGHELAHQWFGNLVTMKWWDDLWLKEGFATFMSYIAVNEVRLIKHQGYDYLFFIFGITNLAAFVLHLDRTNVELLGFHNN